MWRRTRDLETPRIGVARHSGLFRCPFCFEVWPIGLRGSPWKLSGHPLEAILGPEGPKNGFQGGHESLHGELRKEISETSKPIKRWHSSL